MTRAYQEGYEAFVEGVNEDDLCPYRADNGKSDGRNEWMNGWFDHRTKARLGHILDKYPDE